MTGAQLHLAIGIPSALFALNFITVIWQARGLERLLNVRFDSFEKIMNAKFDAVYTKFDAVDAKFEAAHEGLRRMEQVLDARLKHLEER